MSIRDQLVCDYCDGDCTEKVVRETPTISLRVVSDDRFLIYVGEKIVSQFVTEFDFCSLECLTSWLKERGAK